MKQMIQKAIVMLVVFGTLFGATIGMTAGASAAEASTAAAADELPYKDVAESAWYYENVRYVYEGGMMQGVGRGKFDPEGTVTRAMVAMIFWRMQGEPQPEQASGFTDVAEDAWYAEAVAWAEDVGIVEGVGKGRFDPEGSITRQDLMTMFCRYAVAFNGLQMPEKYPTEMVWRWTDCESIADYAGQAVRWAMTQGMARGNTDGTFTPQGNATRAELAALIERYENPTTGLYDAAEAQRVGNEYIASLGYTVSEELATREIVGYYPPDMVNSHAVWIMGGQGHLNDSAINVAQGTIKCLNLRAEENRGEGATWGAGLFCAVTYYSEIDTYEICVYYG